MLWAPGTAQLQRNYWATAACVCVGKCKPQQRTDEHKGCYLTQRRPVFIPTQWSAALLDPLQWRWPDSGIVRQVTLVNSNLLINKEISFSLLLQEFFFLRSTFFSKLITISLGFLAEHECQQQSHIRSKDWLSGPVQWWIYRSRSYTSSWTYQHMCTRSPNLREMRHHFKETVSTWEGTLQPRTVLRLERNPHLRETWKPQNT